MICTKMNTRTLGEAQQLLSEADATRNRILRIAGNRHGPMTGEQLYYRSIARYITLIIIIAMVLVFSSCQDGFIKTRSTGIRIEQRQTTVNSEVMEGERK